MDRLAYWDWVQKFVYDLLSHVPGDTLNDKTGLLADVIGIAGLTLSIGIVVVRIVAQRGKKRPATLADLDRLGTSLVESLQDRIVEQLASKEIARLAKADWLLPRERHEAQNQLRHGLTAAVQSIVSDESEDGHLAATELIKGNLERVEDYFEGQALSEADGVRRTDAAAEALHMKAALRSLHDIGGAVKACLRAVEMNPADPFGWSRLGHLYLRTGNSAEAHAAFQRAVSV